MKHSSISLTELESVKGKYHGLLGRTYREITSYRATNNPDQFRRALRNAAEILSSLRELSLGDTEREKYIDKVLNKNKLFSELNDPLSALGFTGFTTVIMGFNVKPIRDLHDSYKTTLEVKRLEETDTEDAKASICALQQELLGAGRTYIETHQREKLTRIADFRRNNPQVKSPVIVYSSGVYKTGPTINFFGEILHTNLLMVSTDEKTREELREDIKSQPIKDRFKAPICEQIREKDSDAIHHGHRLNFDLIVANLNDINKTLSLYHGRTSRNASCLPVYELEGLLPSLFVYETSTVAPTLTGDHIAINMINRYVNTFLVRYGVTPIEYVKS